MMLEVFENQLHAEFYRIGDRVEYGSEHFGFGSGRFEPYESRTDGCLFPVVDLDETECRHEIDSVATRRRF